MKKKKKEELEENSSSEETTKKKKKSVLKKVGIAFACVIGVPALGVAAFLGYNFIQTRIYNSNPPHKDPHTPDHVIDDNGNDVEIDNNGQIDMDTISEAERAALSNSFTSLIIQDANSRSDYNIDEVSGLISFYLLPYNLCDENNEYDKYFLSILFEADDELYTLNYLTGKDFESEAELSKDYFFDFLNYLNYDCALDSCQKMSENGQKIKGALGDETLYVGDDYLGYFKDGSDYYFIPTYTTSGEGTTYYAQASELDYYDQIPMELLQSELKAGKVESFSSTPFDKSENLQKVADIYSQKLETKTTQNDKELQ